MQAAAKGVLVSLMFPTTHGRRLREAIRQAGGRHNLAVGATKRRAISAIAKGVATRIARTARSHSEIPSGAADEILDHHGAPAVDIRRDSRRGARCQDQRIVLRTTSATRHEVKSCVRAERTGCCTENDSRSEE